jgi:hypothetical protein
VYQKIASLPAALYQKLKVGAGSKQNRIDFTDHRRETKKSAKTDYISCARERKKYHIALNERQLITFDTLHHQL